MHNKFLEKYYFIEKFERSNIDKQDFNTTIIYRNYKKNYNIREILLIKYYCKKRRKKFIISNDIRLSIKLSLDGAYLPSFNKDFSHLNYRFKKDFCLIGSAHNLKEIRIKEKQKVDKIFLSSIFKKNKNYLGIYRFINLKKNTKIKIIALGGITKLNLKKINFLSCYGFSGISFFEKKKRPH